MSTTVKFVVATTAILLSTSIFAQQVAPRLTAQPLRYQPPKVVQQKTLEARIIPSTISAPKGPSYRAKEDWRGTYIEVPKPPSKSPAPILTGPGSVNVTPPPSGQQQLAKVRVGPDRMDKVIMGGAIALDVANSFVSPGPDASLAGAAYLAAKKAPDLGKRVATIHNALDPIAKNSRTTAILEAGPTRIVGSGGRDLTPAQRNLLKPGEVAAKQPGSHAEATVINHATNNGLTPKNLSVSRPICAGCQELIKKTGGKLNSPTTASWR